MTVDDVRQMYDDYCANDEPHNCIYETDAEFVKCEVCDRAQQAVAKMQYNAVQIIEFLLHEIDKRDKQNDIIRGWK